MDIQKCTDAVAGAMAVVEALLPKWEAGDNIELETRNAVGELARSQGNVCLEDVRKALFLALRGRPKVNRACYIGRAVEELRARVAQVQRVPGQNIYKCLTIVCFHTA